MTNKYYLQCETCKKVVLSHNDRPYLYNIGEGPLLKFLLSHGNKAENCPGTLEVIDEKEYQTIPSWY
jgi:hypothetical protein